LVVTVLRAAKEAAATAGTRGATARTDTGLARRAIRGANILAMLFGWPVLVEVQEGVERSLFFSQDFTATAVEDESGIEL